MQTSQKPVMITVIVASLIMLAFSWSWSGTQNTAIDELRNDIESLEFNLPGTSATDEEIVLNTSQFDEKFADLCKETDGCGGWWDVTNELGENARRSVAERATYELTESDNKDLFRAMEDLVDIDEREDIVSVEIDQIGEVRTNQDPNREFTEDRIIEVDFIIKVEFYEDGSNDDTKTKYFWFHGTLDELEDGFEDSDANVTLVEKVSSRFSLP